MRDYLRRLLAALANSGPGYDTRPAPLPARGDAVEAWLKAERDSRTDSHGCPPGWYTLDAVLETYRLHAEAGVPLGESLEHLVGGA